MREYDLSKVLTIGASGSIGAYIDFGMRPSRSELDVLDREAVREYVGKHEPGAIIHLAGATDTRECERDPRMAYMQNAVSAYHISLAAKDVGATVVYLSSSRVFSGKKKTPYAETDAPDPRSAYGHSKYLGEIAVQSIVSAHIIVRTCWVFGGGEMRDKKFYGRVIRALRAGDEVRALDDVHGSPTYAKDLIDAIKDTLRQKKRGVVHIGNAGVASRYDIAHFMAERRGSPQLVKKIQRGDTAEDALLPTNEAVVSEYFSLRPWREALTEYIEEEWKEV